MALASWVFVIWLAGLIFYASRYYVFVGLSLSFALIAGAVALSFALKCPNCGKLIAITAGEARLMPSWKAAVQQFFPLDAWRGTETVVTCPHCQQAVLVRLRGESDV